MRGEEKPIERGGKINRNVLRKFEELLDNIGKRKTKSEFIRNLLLEEREKIETKLKEGFTKKDIYRALLSLMEEEGIGRISYTVFLSIFNEIFESKTKTRPKTKNDTLRPKKLTSTDLL